MDTVPRTDDSSHPAEPAEANRSLEETAYLLQSPRNAARLAEAIAEAESGRATHRRLIDPKL